MPLVLLGIGVAAVEVYVALVVAHLIGGLWTIVALLASTVVGLSVVRGQSRRAWQALRAALQSGVAPGRELGDAALIFAGGVLIAIPGFVTDAAGLLAVAPPTRGLLRRALGAYARRRGAAVPPGLRARPPGTAGQPDSRPEGKIIQGEVLETGSARGGTGQEPDSGREPGRRQ